MEPRFSPSYDRSCVKMAERFASRRYSLKNKLWDRMIKGLLDFRLSQNIVICQCLVDQSFASADLFVTDKSRYFAQPRPIFDNYSLRNFSTFRRPCKNSTSTMHRNPIAHSAWSKTFIIIYIVYNHDDIFSLVIRKFGCLECFFFYGNRLSTNPVKLQCL